MSDPNNVEAPVPLSEENAAGDVDIHTNNKNSGDGTEQPLLSSSAIVDLLKNKEFLENSGVPSVQVALLPAEVRRRVRALKKNQFQVIKLEVQKDLEINEIEKKYQALFAPLYDRRRDIINGDLEPTDPDCELPWEEEDRVEELAGELAKAHLEHESSNGVTEHAEPVPVSGVPNFWRTAFQNCPQIVEMIQEHDEPILNHLTDIRETQESDENNTLSFTLHFHFSSNPFFSNAILTKKYFLKIEQTPDDPLSYSGEEITRCEGCDIHWHQGKNVTVRQVKKKQKHKGRGTTRTVTKLVKQESFFNFFSPPAPAGDDDEDEARQEVEEELNMDFTVGDLIRAQVIPRAVLYFTGDIEDSDDEDEDDDEEGGADGEDDSDDEDADPSYQPAPGEKPADCKAQ